MPPGRELSASAQLQWLLAVKSKSCFGALPSAIMFWIKCRSTTKLARLNKLFARILKSLSRLLPLWDPLFLPAAEGLPDCVEAEIAV